jgi:hypothetical protein
MPQITDDREITVRVQNEIIGEQEGERAAPGGSQTSLPSSKKKSSQIFIAGVSANLFVSGASRLIAATGNQAMAGAVQQTSEWVFLGLRAASMDPAAIATAALKLSSLGIEAIMKYINEKKAENQQYNELTALQMRAGQVIIRSGSTMSYDRFGRLTITDRK